MDVDSAAEELYGLAPEEFVARRTALERAARDDGDRDLARLIRQLAKPTRSAWLVNLLSRDHPETVEELLDLAELLAEGMRALSAPELQQLTRQRGQLVASVTRTAVAAGRDRGHRASEATRTEVSGTLTAALADPDVAEQVRAGRLTRAVSWSGFGLPGAGSTSAPRSDARRRRRDHRAADVAPVVELEPHRREAERKRARQRRKHAADDHRRAREAAARAATRLGEAEDQAARARADSEPVRTELQQAETAVAKAEHALESARREHDRIARAAAQAASSVNRAEQRLAQLRDEDERTRARVSETEDELTAAEDALADLAVPDD